MDKKERLEQEIKYYEDCINLLNAPNKNELIEQFKEEIRIRKQCIEEFVNEEQPDLQAKELDFKIKQLKQEIQKYNHLARTDIKDRNFYKAKRIEAQKAIQQLIG